MPKTKNNKSSQQLKDDRAKRRSDRRKDHVKPGEKALSHAQTKYSSKDVNVLYRSAWIFGTVTAVYMEGKHAYLNVWTVAGIVKVKAGSRVLVR